MLRDKRIDTALSLVREAQIYLGPGSALPECAIWRLVDAAGLLADALPGSAVGVAEATGRGYRLARVEGK